MFVISGSDDTTVRINCINIAQRSFFHTLTINRHNDLVTDVFYCFNRIDSSFIVSGDVTDAIHVWDFRNGCEHCSWKGDLLCTEGGEGNSTPIAVGLTDQRTLSVWNIETKALHRVISGNFGLIDIATVDLSSHVIVLSTFSDGTTTSTLQVWDLDTGKRTRMSKLGTNTVSAMCIVSRRVHRHSLTTTTPTAMGGLQPLVATAYSNNDIVIRDLLSWKVRRFLRGHTEPVFALTVWIHGNHAPLLASGGGDCDLRIWDVQKGRQLLLLPAAHEGYIYSVSFCAGHKVPVLVSGGVDKKVQVWDITPLLREMNWERRRAFLLFLTSHSLSMGLSYSYSPTPTLHPHRVTPSHGGGVDVRSYRETRHQCDDSNGNLERCFRSKDICSLISSYL
eukprot:gene36667-47796_t